MTNQAIILERATEILGEEAAKEWVEKTSATLGGKPNDLAATDEGRDIVLLHLAGISRHNQA
jgi:uncharacterized protein (DUF2384 family)